MSLNELAVNYHMTEACNYRCGYCYAHWNENPARDELHHRPDGVEHLLRALAGYFFDDTPLRRRMGYDGVRLNFAGGEPMLLGDKFSHAVALARHLGFTCSLITNGHYLDDRFAATIMPLLSMIGISIDSADVHLQTQIGRCDRGGRALTAAAVLTRLTALRQANPAAKIKLNTVVNRHNHTDDMNDLIERAAPDKWKVLRVLPVHGDALAVTDTQFQAYVHRHRRHADRMAVEDNASMTASYLMLNPRGCFYQNGDAGQGYRQSRPVLDVGIAAALGEITFDETAFRNRYRRASQT